MFLVKSLFLLNTVYSLALIMCHTNMITWYLYFSFDLFHLARYLHVSNVFYWDLGFLYFGTVNKVSRKTYIWQMTHEKCYHQGFSGKCKLKHQHDNTSMIYLKNLETLVEEGMLSKNLFAAVRIFICHSMETGIEVF